MKRELFNKYYAKSRSRAKTGTVNHNLANEVDYQYNMELFGGESLLRKNYPEVYKMLKNTQEASVQALNNPVMQPMARTLAVDPYLHGLKDIKKIVEVEYNPKTNLSTTSSSTFVEENPTLIIMGELNDVTNKKSVDGFALFDHNVKSIEGGASVKSSSLVRSEDRTYQAITTFSNIEFDANGNPLLNSVTQVSEDKKQIKALNPIKNINVIDPQPIRHPGKPVTAIFYNRSGDHDYTFANVKTIGYKEVDVHIPFSGSIEFEEGIIPVDLIFDDCIIDLTHRDENKGGGAEYNNWDAVKNNLNPADGTKIYSFEKNDKTWTMKWKFPNEWKHALETTEYNAINDLKFYCAFMIKTKMEAVPGSGLYIESKQRVTIQSDDDLNVENEFSTKCPIPYIRLFWGCFARGTKIKMADNSLKAVEEITSGDEVMTMGGEAVTVNDIVSGSEEKVIYIETTRGNSIMVTEDHPMLTTEGIVLAKDLTAGSVMLLEDGEDGIVGLYYKEYNDMVFSLVLEKESTIISEQFYTGDFDSQQRAMSDAVVVKQPKKLEPFQEEITELFRLLNL